MTIEIGTLVLKGLPPVYSRAIETGLAARLESMLAGAEPMGPRNADGVTARLPQDWQRMRPERFVAAVAESICREVGAK